MIDSLVDWATPHARGLIVSIGAILVGFMTLQSARTGRFSRRGGETVTEVGSARYFMNLGIRILLVAIIVRLAVQLW